MLSNQLGNMISSFTDEFDIGFDYCWETPLPTNKLTVQCLLNSLMIGILRFIETKGFE